jgi:hypothetical protein
MNNVLTNDSKFHNVENPWKTLEANHGGRALGTSQFQSSALHIICVELTSKILFHTPSCLYLPISTSRIWETLHICSTWVALAHVC